MIIKRFSEQKPQEDLTQILKMVLEKRKSVQEQPETNWLPPKKGVKYRSISTERDQLFSYHLQGRLTHQARGFLEVSETLVPNTIKGWKQVQVGEREIRVQIGKSREEFLSNFKNL